MFDELRKEKVRFHLWPATGRRLGWKSCNWEPIPSKLLKLRFEITFQQTIER